jgi:nicotinamidase-related amidase
MTMTNPKLEVLTPQNSQVIFIDHQPQMAFGVQSIDRQTLKNNVVGLAKAAKVFKIPTTITTVETQGFSGYTYPELLEVFPDKPLLERSSMRAAWPLWAPISYPSAPVCWSASSIACST